MTTSKSSNRLHILVGLVLVGLLGWGFFSFVASLYRAFSSLNAQVAITIVAGCVTVLTSVTAIVLGKHLESRKDRIAAHRDKKVVLYEDLSSKLFATFYGEDTKTEDLIKFLRETQRRLILWSGPHVVVAFANWHKSITSTAGSPTVDNMIKFVEFLLSLRSDLGHSNKGIETEHLVRFILKNSDLFMQVYKRNPHASFAELVELEKAMTEKKQ